MDLTAYRASTSEQERTDDLVRLMPSAGEIALDIGARDGHFSRLLAERFGTIVALDLCLPRFMLPKVLCIQGDVTKLSFSDKSIDFILCAEVLEHIPPDLLPLACNELQRVCRGKLLIGVPYRQDLRLDRLTCSHCKKKNPPWGHVNQFDENVIANLFKNSAIEFISYVGHTRAQTNILSAFLMDLAGNPYGTYMQDEPCIHCGKKMPLPPPRNLTRKILTRLAIFARSLTRPFKKERAKWIHVILHPHYLKDTK
ncbi:hypothetical protein CKCBHOJB_00992 [Thauera sp. GDN1]|uniref:class I SAM-dependent methyltransferase n=1 Tax=Thauera sp. GDN1 TaxID=2944810 RepID=UPI0024798EFE|nr:class I SAM-dependent methyltransferase [Thauera sp. GDN1]WEN41440.1 hypothetical protein CKCBHOJB_00992 [Thauera sp. GDN1]